MQSYIFNISLVTYELEFYKHYALSSYFLHILSGLLTTFICDVSSSLNNLATLNWALNNWLKQVKK